MASSESVRPRPAVKPRAIELATELSFALAAFLFFVDVCILPATLPPDTGKQTDRLAAGLWVLTQVWGLPLPLQYGVAAALTATVALIRRKITGSAWSVAPGRKWRWRWLITATTMVLLGWGLRQWAKRTLAASFTYVISNPEELITTGPYRWWVHPGYAGIVTHVVGLVMIAALPCSHPLAITASMTAVVLALVFLRINDEETMLASAYEVRWVAHVATRWRLVPFLY